MFGDIAARLAGLLAGRVLVAHNLPFDVRFLCAEYATLGGGGEWKKSQSLANLRPQPELGGGVVGPHGALLDVAAHRSWSIIPRWAPPQRARNLRHR